MQFDQAGLFYHQFNQKKCSSNFILYTEDPFLAKIITHRKSCFALHIKELLKATTKIRQKSVFPLPPNNAILKSDYSQKNLIVTFPNNYLVSSRRRARFTQCYTVTELRFQRQKCRPSDCARGCSWPV